MSRELTDNSAHDLHYGFRRRRVIAPSLEAHAGRPGTGIAIILIHAGDRALMGHQSGDVVNAWNRADTLADDVVQVPCGNDRLQCPVATSGMLPYPVVGGSPTRLPSAMCLREHPSVDVTEEHSEKRRTTDFHETAHDVNGNSVFTTFIRTPLAHSPGLRIVGGRRKTINMGELRVLCRSRESNMRAIRKTTSTHRPTAIDLFSGCGGLTIGMKRAGFSVLAAIECWDVAVEAYKLNHKEVRVISTDIREYDPVELMHSLKLRIGQLDLLAGCPPCQGFSSLRTLNGKRPIADRQNDLIFEFARFAIAFLPKTILLENVPALASDERLVRVTSILSAAGYNCVARVLDAADYGVPQRRKRLLFLASRVGKVSFPLPSRKRVTVRSVIENLPVPGESGDPLHDSQARHSPAVAAMIKLIPRDGGSRADLGQRAQLPCHQRLDGFHDIYGRMHWDGVSPTITTGCINPSKGRFLHPEQDRVISLREASLLQGFPRRYRLPLKRGRYPIAKLIGNAFPPEFVRRQAVQLRRLLLQSGR